MESNPDLDFPVGDDANFIDEGDVADAGDQGWWWELPAAELRDVAMDDLESISFRGRIFIADRYRVIGEIVRQAEETPEPWVGPDPTLDPGWVDPRERTAAQVRRERRDFAVRAAVADIAVRLRMSETTVRSHAGHVHTLRTRCAMVWESFLSGGVSEQNATATAHLAASLPYNDPQAWAAFDQQVSAVAGRLTPAKFRTRARSIRERVHPESLEERHQRAVEDRDVWTTPELDGMAFIGALVPADKAQAAIGGLDAHARHLHRQDGETRTFAQLRADTFIDLLTSGGTGNGKGTRAAVAITVPVMTLVGQSTEPATLDGYGPIDLETAKRLAGSATSWVRILTHPITGTVLDVDRKTYRVPKALRRWLGVQHRVCIFPGCNRPAHECDIDHILDWQFGGTTANPNLAPECKRHHPLKHGSKWTLNKAADTLALFWTSPTGYIADGDPAPF